MLRNTCFLFACVCIAHTTRAQHPFKFDHTIYNTVYLTEAFRMMDSLKQFILLDVRTPGEFYDTSRATALDIGRIKGAENIPVDIVPGQLANLKKHLHEPIFIYCSHSQRSRRVSKLLAENGFTKVYNINGGMTLLNEMDDAGFPYKNKVLVTNLTYKNLANTDAFHLIQNTPGLVIIDIRSEKEFASKDSLQKNNIGHLKNAINIPQEGFAEKLNSYHFPKNSPVLLYDLEGYNSMDVIDILRSRGYTTNYNLFEGLEGFIADHRLKKEEINQVFADGPSFQMLDPKGCMDLIFQKPNLVILDTRTLEEFNNTANPAYLNIGHIRGAIHVSTLDSLEIILREKDRSTPFLVYGRGSDFAFMVCHELIKNGYNNVNLLSQGLYHFVWSTANVDNCQDGRAMLTDHEGLY